MTEERLQISIEVLQALKDLAAKRNHSLRRTLEHCINTELYMDKQLKDGRTILVQDPADEQSCNQCGYHGAATYKIVFSHMN